MSTATKAGMLAFERVAHAAARRAGALLRARYTERHEIAFKSSAIDLVTDADRDAEALIVAILGEAFPEHGIVAEESAARPSRDGHQWYVDPLRDETFSAVRGEGARLNGSPIAVSPLARLEHALLATGFPYDRRQRAEHYVAFLMEGMRRAQGVRREGSAALDLCWVACGRL